MTKFMYIALLMSLTSSLNAVNPMCNKSCGECSLWFPMLKLKATEMRRDYLNAETALNSRYNSKIIPLIKERKRLLKQYDKLVAEYESLNKILAIELKKINLKRKQQ